MAASNQLTALQDPKLNDVERRTTNLQIEQKEFDYAGRAQWLRAAVLGANHGLVSTASLMMGIGAVKQDIKAMILTGFAGLVAGAIGEFVSVYSQLDIELAQMKRKAQAVQERGDKVEVVVEEEDGGEESLPNPVQAAAASALSFSVGAMVPLLSASFIREYRARVAVVAAAVTVALVLFGWLERCWGSRNR